MFREKRKQIFSSLSKRKISFIVLSYLLCGFIIAIVARAITKRLKPCCCCSNGEIIPNHNVNYFLCYCKAEYRKEEQQPLDVQNHQQYLQGESVPLPLSAKDEIIKEEFRKKRCF